MIRTFKLEEHEKAAIATVIDMFAQIMRDRELVNDIHNTENPFSITGIIENLENFYNRYA